MAATGLKRRVEALENRTDGAFVPWVRVIQYEDQSEADAMAKHEAENGPIGDCNRILRVIIRKPGRCNA